MRHGYFGAWWDAPMTDDLEQVPTPVGEPCIHCGEPVVEGDQGTFMVDAQDPPYRLVPVHRECGLRAVMGGIGHHENHAYWCTEKGDPDGGRSYRQSALEVWAMVNRWSQ